MIYFDVFSSLRFFVIYLSVEKCAHNHCQDSDLRQLSLAKKHNMFQNFFKPQLALHHQKSLAARCPNMAPGGPKIPQYAIRFSRIWHGRVGFAMLLQCLMLCSSKAKRRKVRAFLSYSLAMLKKMEEMDAMWRDEACHICAKWSFLANPLCTPPILPKNMTF